MRLADHVCCSLPAQIFEDLSPLAHFQKYLETHPVGEHLPWLQGGEEFVNNHCLAHFKSPTNSFKCVKKQRGISPTFWFKSLRLITFCVPKPKRDRQCANVSVKQSYHSACCTAPKKTQRRSPVHVGFSPLWSPSETSVWRKFTCYQNHFWNSFHYLALTVLELVV